MSPDEGAIKGSGRPMNPDVFDELYEAHKASTFSLACYLTRSRREAEDLFQETWLRVVKQLTHKPVDSAGCKAWIMTIATNLYRDWLRKKRVRWRFSGSPSDSFAEESLWERPFWGTGADGIKESERQEIQMAVSKALKGLPEKQRLVFVLKEMEGFRYTEIGEILSLPVGTVKSLLHRAVKRLRRELWGYAPKKTIIASV
jgi:RNA polymerase sigma-70 factor (ECF subfamily)